MQPKQIGEMQENIREDRAILRPTVHLSERMPIILTRGITHHSHRLAMEAIEERRNQRSVVGSCCSCLSMVRHGCPCALHTIMWLGLSVLVENDHLSKILPFAVVTKCVHVLNVN